MASGLCECGCGGATPVALRTDRAAGLEKGQPRRFINGHNRRKGAADYLVDENGCWIWQRATNRGYGTLTRNGRKYYAHRWFYEQRHGRIPAGLQVDHLCGVPACINPDHLEAVPQRANVRRAHAVLTDEQEREIVASSKSARSLADAFGVSHMTVLRVRRHAPSDFDILNGLTSREPGPIAWAA